jgi:peptidoglycan-N-acetylglucosamine deacetylase
VSTSVCLTFEPDAMALWSGTIGSRNASDLSRGDFERIAVPRVLRLLERFDVRATWFVPGAVAVLFPDLVRRVVDNGHEVAHHGWAHEPVGSQEVDDRRILERGLETLEEFAGDRPLGYRVPGGFVTDRQLELLLEYGFLWDSSLQGSDFSAYYVRRGDSITPDGAYQFGEPIDVVEIPVSWQLDDFPAFEFVWGLNSGLRAPSHVLEIWKDDFDFMRRDVAGGVYSPCLHTQVIARGHRLLMFERLLDYISEVDDVLFETVSSYVGRWKEANALG